MKYSPWDKVCSLFNLLGFLARAGERIKQKVIRHSARLVNRERTDDEGNKSKETYVKSQAWRPAGRRYRVIPFLRSCTVICFDVRIILMSYMRGKKRIRPKNEKSILCINL